VQVVGGGHGVAGAEVSQASMVLEFEFKGVNFKNLSSMCQF
jgi:hypothetical protein